MVWHIICAKILRIVNNILTDGIRTFLNTLTKKIEDNCKITFFCSGIINLLFDGLAYKRSGHCSLLVFYTTQLAKYLHVLYAKPSNKVCILQGAL